MARIPSRFGIMVIFSIALLSGCGLAWLASKMRPKNRGSVCYALVFSLSLLGLLLEFLPIPIYTTKPSFPDYCQLLKKGKGEAVLHLPLGWRSGTFQLGSEITRWQYYQTFHHKKLLSGFCARVPSGTMQEIASQPIISTLLQLQSGCEVPLQQRAADRKIAAGFFSRMDSGYAVLDNNCRHPLSKEIFQDLLDYLEFIGGKKISKTKESVLLELPYSAASEAKGKRIK